MLLPAVEVFVAPVAFLGGDPDPEIGVIGRYGRDLLVDAEVAALFEDLHREFAAQHTGLSPSSEESSSVESDSDPWASVVPVTISRSSVPKYFEASSNE